jgi:pSer/pThr/pTyr-binding forkhead associated (FHA) protein
MRGTVLFGQFEIMLHDDTRRIIEIRDTATLGCSPDNDIVLDDWAVSPCHALVLTRVGGLTLIDLRSANGTFVNEMLVAPDQQVFLEDGDLIRIGSLLLRYTAPR